jgi:ABA sandwich protein
MSETIKWAELTTEQRNVLVHEKVMGKDPQERCPGTPERTDIADWYCAACHQNWLEKPPAVHTVVIPSYTTNMDAAWQVLTHMCHEPEWTEQMMLFINYLDDGEVVDRNVTRSEPIFTLTRLAALTPEAICVAALKACGVDVSQ